jgi:hypothetical protein
LAWETDRNGHGNLDIYARMLNPTGMPEAVLGSVEDVTLAIQGQDLNLGWTAPVNPDLDHYFIYRSENQTDFDFTTPHHDTSGDPDPLNTSWMDPSAAGPGAPQSLYYTIRAVDSNGTTGFTNGTFGKWTKAFDQGLNVFSLPLEPVTLKNVSFYVNDIPNVQYIRWMDSNGRWVTHDKGMGAGVNDAVVRLGDAYEIFLTTATNYSFTGRPASTIRHHEGFGDLLADRYSITASAAGDDVSLTWTDVPGAEYYLVYRTQSRGFLDLGGPVRVTPLGHVDWIDRGALSSDGVFHYMVIPMDDTGEIGSGSYSVGVSRRTFGQGISTFALALEIEQHLTLGDMSNQMQEITGMAYLTSGIWKFHAREMPAGIYDSVIEQSDGYQVSMPVSKSQEFTLIGW